MRLTLDPYRPGPDDAEVLDLRTRVWGADHPHTSAAFLTWLFRDNPVGEGGGVLLRRGGTLIGFAGLCPRLALRNGETVRVAHGLDFMVDPAATRGLSGTHAVRVAAGWADLAAAQGYAFGINFPNANSIRLLTSDRLGWRPVLSPRLLVRPLPGLRLREGLPAGIPHALADLGSSVLARGLDLAVRLRVRGWPTVSARHDFAWLAPVPSPGEGIGLARDPAVLAWRYLHHPLHRYRLFTCGDGAGASGLVAAPRTLFGVPSSLVVDLLGAEHPTAAAALVAAAVADAAGQGARIVGGLALAGSPLDRALRRAGFLPVPARLDPKPFHLVARPLAEPGQDGFSGRWRFAWGDMDVV